MDIPWTRKILPQYHCQLDCDSEPYQQFREQLCILTFEEMWGDKAVFIKSMMHVCQPGAASFDPESPGSDSLAAWQAMDDLIEKHDVRGFFHTHPRGFNDFSGQDYKVFEGLARTNGKKLIWQVVQAAGEAQMRAACFNMVGGVVFMYDFGLIEHDVYSSVVFLPVPPQIDTRGKIKVLTFA